MMIELYCTLDRTKHIPVSVSFDAGLGRWSVRIMMHLLRRDRLKQFLTHHLRLHCGNRELCFVREGDVLLAEVSDMPIVDPCSVMLRHAPMVRVRVQDGQLMHDLADHHRLSVMELRMLGQYPHAHVPYSRAGDIWERVHSYLRTDLHTHLSSQISSEGLLEVASMHDALYPVELLERHGITTEGLTRHVMRSTFFAPARSEKLRCEQENCEVEGIYVRELKEQYPHAWTRFIEVLHIPVDEVHTFDMLERQVYRMRNPLTKNPALVRSTLLRVAQEYRQQGIDYAELAVTAAFDTAWLRAATEAILEAEERTGVQLRLLAAIPRSLPPVEMLHQLALVKYIAQHPYVVGVDFLGYEANKTQNFAWALNHVARFAAQQARGIATDSTGWDFADDFILRVHAGENGKNPDNVSEVLDIAFRHGIRVRVGHAAYGHERDYQGIARIMGQRNQLIVEFNPDSNMAMNNIDMAEQLPITAWAQAGIPIVIASDGAGIYQTDAQQLLAAGMYAGLEDAHLEHILATEQKHCAHQQALFMRKQQAFITHYAHNDAFFLTLEQQTRYLKQQDAMQRLAHKRPLLIAGASGSSWSRISINHQKEITRAIHQLVHSLDPDKVYFALGRIKHEGIGRIVDDAISEYLTYHPNARPFDVVGMISLHQNMPTLATHLNHIVVLHGELMSVPTHMTEKLALHHGSALYIGGSAFTRDFIKRSEDLGIPFGVMAEIEGASGEKARVLESQFIFHGAAGMIHQVRTMLGDDVFRV
ncbi:MAG: hypothetical protein EAY65_03690 [Alphaproteobacteria bacterium]|nr:MAG: hypothetical protein EAY65_03690 [Alphaproteobacteria bacterium]